MIQYSSKSQKASGHNIKGSKHLLLVDRAVTQDSKSRQIYLNITWIDNKKAYNSNPDTWILEGLAQCKANRVLITFIRNSMQLWKTTPEANSKAIVQIPIKRSIYQGNAHPCCCFA